MLARPCRSEQRRASCNCRCRLHLLDFCAFCNGLRMRGCDLKTSSVSFDGFLEPGETHVSAQFRSTPPATGSCKMTFLSELYHRHRRRLLLILFSQNSMPQAVPCRPSWPSVALSLPHPLTCQDCISPAKLHTSVEPWHTGGIVRPLPPEL